MIEVIAWAAVGTWLWLVFARGGFWRAGPREERAAVPVLARWPAVIAVIPARNEAQTVGGTIRSLLDQNYPGDLRLIVVDDGSEDGTGSVAWACARRSAGGDRVQIVAAGAPPPGWTGKVWAQHCGVDLARRDQPDYLLLTDADIAYEPGTLSALVARAEEGGLVLTSVMAKLRCVSFAERCVVPAFVYFFQMLYPFAWVNRRDRLTAAAAGGCMLVRREALESVGGIGSVHSALIDDCALARRLKPVGPIWLGLSERVRSVRPNDDFASLRRMVTRSAYAQLRYSPLLLVATVLAMTFVFIGPLLLALAAADDTSTVGAGAYAIMVASFQPTLRLYRQSPLWGVAMPVIAALYTVWTIDSAVQYALGRGGLWKGRVQAMPTARSS
jgi:hopene-associated glycosyltransferase HpnB